MVSATDVATMRDGLSAYLVVNGFPPDGGDSERWAVVRIGPIPVAYPNIEARRRAVRYHDLHHVVTGYSTDLCGEVEISAWEVRTGCKGYWVAWALGLSGLLAVFKWPRETIRAFARGRQCQNLYGQDYDEVLDRQIADVQNELGLLDETSPRWTDPVMVVALLPLAAVATFLVGAVVVATAPWWLRAGVHRERRTSAT